MHLPFTGLAAGGVWGLREGFKKDISPRNIPSAASATAPGAPVTATGTAPPASTVGAQATAFANTAAAKASATASPAAGAAAAEQAARSTVSRRLRWNNVLNQVTRRGSFTGNSAGVLGASPSHLCFVSHADSGTPNANSFNLQRFQLDSGRLPRWEA